MNKEYIVANLCENRKKPEMHCNGKCFLEKKLKQADDNEKKHGEKDDLKNMELYLLQFFEVSLTPPFTGELIPKPASQNNPIYAKNCIGSIFRPPRSAV
ncbi:hypothetical protein [Flavobacterium piscisymbiosum]|uniref:Uncharacterized protein n=1 Tax=Flavobacterium piscisymbiosum TaxID=2893753 RepID=A0ABS8ME13_9FLAO|nr:hypothetical protein [Flavobacterium sp. F-30]MCC9063716.1 hypothetical protein [Flavobacterium sp. F-30]